MGTRPRVRATPAPATTMVDHRRRLLVAAAAALLTSSACSGSDDPPSADSTGSPDLAAGQQVYGDFCGSCHGRDFQGGPQGPSQLDPLFTPEVTTDADYRAAIRNGAPEQRYDFGPMPAIGSLDDQEITDVIAYIRSVQQERGVNGSQSGGAAGNGGNDSGEGGGGEDRGSGHGGATGNDGGAG